MRHCILLASPISEDKIYEHYGQESGDCGSPDARWTFQISLQCSINSSSWRYAQRNLSLSETIIAQVIILCQILPQRRNVVQLPGTPSYEDTSEAGIDVLQGLFCTVKVASQSLNFF